MTRPSITDVDEVVFYRSVTVAFVTQVIEDLIDLDLPKKTFSEHLLQHGLVGMRLPDGQIITVGYLWKNVRRLSKM